MQVKDLAQFTLEVGVREGKNVDEDPACSDDPTDLPADLKLDDEVRLDRIKFAEESRNEAAANLRPPEQGRNSIDIFVGPVSGLEPGPSHVWSFLTCLVEPV